MPFEQLSFRHPWRPYQERVLNAIHDHLSDKRLHIVAAPGAGKTSLGLEVFRLLEKNTLVMSPTRVIRDQWIQRLVDFSATTNKSPFNWVSTDIRKPGIFTSVTYQALHWQLSNQITDDNSKQFTDDIEIEDVPQALNKKEIQCLTTLLKQHGIGVLILDEAHHLTNEWWRVLDALNTANPDLVLVSLTATPPYDAQNHNWQRYEQLCGPVDEEISIPELVKAGTLCPHQDYVWTEAITESEQQQFITHDKNVVALCDSLFVQAEFNQLVQQHKWLTSTITAQDILNAPELAAAILAFMAARQQHLPVGLLRILDFTQQDIPPLNRSNWQILLSAVLFSNDFSADETQQRYVEQLKRQLAASQILQKRQLLLSDNPVLHRALALNPVKIKACVSIHRLEYQLRQSSLRQVILTDYIRDEQLSTNITSGPLSLGAWPVFNALVHTGDTTAVMGLLTGRLSLLPSELVTQLSDEIDQMKLKAVSFPELPNYSKLIGPLNAQTNFFTRLLSRGQIQVLVGTRALLGEGWDAPVINSLILATAVGSFMLTNQMRGRAIRLDRNDTNKASSIWHLLAVDTRSFFGMQDIKELARRFDTFVGLSERKDTIESGFSRLNVDELESLHKSNNKSVQIRSSNNKMKDRLSRLPMLQQRWQQALTLDNQAQVMPGVSSERVPTIRWYHTAKTFKFLLAQLILLMLMSTALSLYMARVGAGLSIMLAAFVMCTIGGMLYMLPTTARTIKILLKHLPVDGTLKQIGLALTEALCQTGHINTPFRRLNVQAVELDNGNFFLALRGGSYYESSLFADCLNEILSPIDNPRYLVIRTGQFLGIARDDYHAVPIRLAATKEQAHTFYRFWSKYVGPGDLVYCRTDSGRAYLLKARMQAFSSAFKLLSKRQDRWV